MEEKIRAQLLRKYMRIQYPVVVLLLLFLFFAYAWTVFGYQRDQVELFAFEESEEYYHIFKGDVRHTAEQNIERPKSTDYNFYYAYDEAGELAGQRLPPVSIRDRVEWFMREGTLASGGIYTDVFRAEEWFFSPRMYILTKKVIYDGEGPIGTIYAGRNTTKELRGVLRVLAFFLFLTILVFALLCRILLHMVDEAMRPILKALVRQREFAADASHELRTPLSVLTVSMDFLKRDMKNVFSECSQEVLQDMELELRRMRDLIENLLLLARSDRKDQSAEREIVDAADIARRQCRSFRLLAERKNLSLELELATGQAPVQADSAQFNQMLAILLDNAVKYTAEGGVKVRLARRNGGFSLAVSDTGCGIAKEEQQAVFRRFYRSDKARCAGGGTGLGLAIAAFLAEKNEMKLELESELGEGSTFSLFMKEFKV